MNLIDYIKYSFPFYILKKTFPGPVNNKRFAVDRAQIDKTPESTVKTFIPVVAHHKKRMIRHSNRSEIIPWPNVAGNNMRVRINAIVVI